MIGKPTTYHRTGFVAVAVATVLTLALGWRAAKLAAPTEQSHLKLDVPVRSERSDRRAYLVYSTYRVTDRGEQDIPNDDSVTYEFHRYSLDGTGTHARIAKVEQGRQARTAAPWMRRVSDAILVFAPRNADAPDALEWIDVGGSIIDIPETDEEIAWSGIPSPDGSVIAYADTDRTAISLVTLRDGLTQSYGAGGFIDSGHLAPIAWNPEGSLVYLKPVVEGDAPVPGLWVLDIDAGEIREFTSVREAGVANYTMSADARVLVGSSFRCDNLESCGIGPSSLLMLDLQTGGNMREILRHQVLAYAKPLVSPDGKRTAYTFTSEAADIRVVENTDPSTDRRFISGRALAWTPNGTGLVIERDGRIQIVDVTTGHITTVVERIGKYTDPDFLGIDVIGIIEKR